jgi:NAD(P)-dependent dehydrogenase (short-subunit alcohol dehydrogenase family)
MNAMRVLITGCSSGFGRAAAGELTKRGHDVIATARRPESIDDLDVAQCVALDVNVDDSVAAARATIGPVEAVVNNAGIGGYGPIEHYPLDLARSLFETNFFGALRVIQAWLPPMREAGFGRIVNVSSVQGFVTSPLGGIYSATKRALEAVTEAMHFEAGHFGVRTILVEPGFFATEFSANSKPIEGGPYQGLVDEWEGADSKLLGTDERPGPELVASVIADVIEADDPPVRVPVGNDAEMVYATRKALDDREFEATMRQVLDLKW